MLIEGFGTISPETSIQKDKAILPEKTFQSESNYPKQEKVLGIGFLNAPTGNVSYGMRAEYAEDSKPDHPIIKVTIQKIGSEEVHYVNVNDVNARSASEIEMFALCSYADDTGQGTGGKFGTWHTLNYYRMNASDNGEFEFTKSLDLCLSVKQNWLLMIEKMKKLYMESGLYKQALDGDSLLRCLQLRKHGDKIEKYSEYMEKEADSDEDFHTSANGNCSVNEIYKSMSWSWWGGTNESFTGIDIYNMPNCGASLYLSDEGILTCIDDEEGGGVLWEIPVDEDGFNKILELMKEGKDFILKDKDVVESYLAGTITKDDIQKLQDLIKNHSVYDGFFENCSEAVKKAWENIQGSDKISSFNGDLDEKVYFLTEIDKYVLMYLSNNVKKFDGSLESTLRFVEDVTNSLKDSLDRFSSKMQTLKLRELDVLTKFKEELEKLK